MLYMKNVDSKLYNVKERKQKTFFVIDDNINNDKTKSYKKMLNDYGIVMTLQDFIKEKR